MKKVLLVLLVLGMAGIVNAAVMSQDFGVANFAADTDFSSSGVMTHTGTGSTDLGFEVSGLVSTNGGGFLGVYDNQFDIKHFSSTFTGVKSEWEDPIWGVDLDYGNPRTGFIRFDSVDLTDVSSLSMSIGEFTGGTNTGDDDVVIRLYLNGAAGFGTRIFDTRGGSAGTLDETDARNGAVYDGTTLSYNFLDTDTSTILYVAVLTDDGDNDGYYIDNVSFVPEPMTLSLLGFGGLALLRRRRA